MRIWKQLLLCIVVLAGALGLWVYLVPSAGGTLTRMGVPGEVIAAVIPRSAAQPAPAPAGGAGGNAAVRPQGEGGAQGATQNGQRGAGGLGGGQGGGNRATLVVAADLIARTARPPAELPLGAVTAIIGVPFFLARLRRLS